MRVELVRYDYHRSSIRYVYDISSIDDLADSVASHLPDSQWSGVYAYVDGRLVLAKCKIATNGVDVMPYNGEHLFPFTGYDLVDGDIAIHKDSTGVYKDDGDREWWLARLLTNGVEDVPLGFIK